MKVDFVMRHQIMIVINECVAVVCALLNLIMKLMDVNVMTVTSAPSMIGAMMAHVKVFVAIATTTIIVHVITAILVMFKNLAVTTRFLNVVGNAQLMTIVMSHVMIVFVNNIVVGADLFQIKLHVMMEILVVWMTDVLTANAFQENLSVHHVILVNPLVNAFHVMVVMVDCVVHATTIARTVFVVTNHAIPRLVNVNTRLTSQEPHVRMEMHAHKTINVMNMDHALENLIVVMMLTF
jgi:hypothetical protein